MLQIASIVNALYRIFTKDIIVTKALQEPRYRSIRSEIYCIVVQIIYKKGWYNP